MLKKPLSEDDGRWFYYSVFRPKGLRQFHGGYKPQGFYGIHWIFAMIGAVVPLKSARSYYLVKAVWYWLTALSLYWLSALYWGGHLGPFIGAALFILVTAVPNTLFMFTYGEHFFLLPINLCLISIHYGLASSNPLLFLLAGVFSAWACQIKVTSLAVSLAAPLLFFAGGNPFTAFVSYVLGYILLTLSPYPFIRNAFPGALKTYLHGIYGPVLQLILQILKRFRPAPARRAVKKVEARMDYNARREEMYVTHMLKSSTKGRFERLAENMGPPLADLCLIPALALVQLGFPDGFDPMVAAVFSLFLVYAAMQQAQQNYYTPHFNPVWVPLCLLGGKSAAELIPARPEPTIWMMFGGAVLLLWLGRIVFILARSFRADQKDSFGHADSRLGPLFRFAEAIGTNIGALSKPGHKLLVWGDQPSIYVYSQREIFDYDYFFVYAHYKKVRRPYALLSLINEKPPELILFYKWRVQDEWGMETIKDHLSVPYRLEKRYKIDGDNGDPYVDHLGYVYDFPLYRRDDSKYKDILFDRFFIYGLAGNRKAAQECMETVLAIDPDDYEAYSLRHNLNLFKDLKAAVKTYTHVLEIYDDERMPPLARLILGKIGLRLGPADSALAHLKEAERLKPGDCRILGDLGLACFQAGDQAGGLRRLGRAMAGNPYLPSLHHNMGVILAGAGELDRAAESFHKAVQLMPDYEEAAKKLEIIQKLQRSGS